MLYFELKLKKVLGGWSCDWTSTYSWNLWVNLKSLKMYFFFQTSISIFQVWRVIQNDLQILFQIFEIISMAKWFLSALGWPNGLGLGLPCWRSQVRNPLPGEARGSPSGWSSSHWACLVWVTLRVWFTSYFIEVRELPFAQPKSSCCGFPLSKKKKQKRKRYIASWSSSEGWNSYSSYCFVDLWEPWN